MQRFLVCLLNPESNKANSPEIINIIVSGKPGAVNVCENCAPMDGPEVLCVNCCHVKVCECSRWFVILMLQWKD